MIPDAVTAKLEALPAQPGVYLFKDKKGVVVYVGKAKSLRSRVRSYFQTSTSDERYFIPLLQRTLGDLDTIVTSTEKEATILENTLIKEHHPRYNIKLRDDKEYLSLRIGATHLWPRLDVVRLRTARDPREGREAREKSTDADASACASSPSSQPSTAAQSREGRDVKEGARYFGPYHSATAARRTLHLINKHFQLRTCSDAEFAGRKRPCLQHQIKRCPAPCVYPVDHGWYGEQVETVAKFLDGRHDELSRELEQRMQKAARDMRFELAVVYRDQLRAIEKVRQEQRVVMPDELDRDVVGLYREGDLVELAVLHVRSGKLADVTTLSIKQAEIPAEEILAAFLAQHYGAAREGIAQALAFIPREIVLPIEPEGIAGIAEWLSDRAGRKVVLIQPRRGARVDLLELATSNAKHAFAEKRRQSDDVQARLTELQERLRLPSIPRRIECCDISHLGGGDTAGAVVAMLDGALDKKRYRSFHVRTQVDTVGLGDDYAAMYEVLARRFRRARVAQESMAEKTGGYVAGPAPAAVPAPAGGRTPADDSEWDLPDLFVVDGGRGQLGVALAAAHDLGLHDLPIVGLAKERETVGGETMVDRIYLPGQKNPIPLRSNTASLFFLARLRDEAHRFSNLARERIGKRRRFHSPLDDVRGIGPVTKRALLQHIGGVAAIQVADDAALLAVPGVTQRQLRALRAAFPAHSQGAARTEG